MEIALVIANILLVIATFALVGVTWHYARHTNRMADIMHKDYELRTTPLAANIKAFVGTASLPRIRFSLIVKNKGYCRIRIVHVQWHWWSKIQQGTERVLYSYLLDKWLTEGQEERFDLPEIDIPEKWRVPEFNPFKHIAIEGWVEVESPVGVSKRYEVKTNL
jgi:hypothetical protein